MNCPSCGAENDVDARFCAECGTPLENQAVEAAKAGQVFDAGDEDATIMSTPGELAAEAKTMTVDQAKVAASLDEEAAPAATLEPEPSPPPPPVPTPGSSMDDQSGSSSDDGDSGSNRRMMIIIGVIILLVLCCCCCSVAVGGVIGSDPNSFEDLMREFTMLPAYLLIA